MILFALQVCPLDCNDAVELVRLICDIETEQRDYHWLLSYRADTPLRQVGLIENFLRKKFSIVDSHRARVFASGWPAGSNALWGCTMVEAAQMHLDGRTNAEGVLTFEPDCVPCRRNWMDCLAQAYANRTKPIVGNLYASAQIEAHINGNAIFPIRLLFDKPDLREMPLGMAWDYHHRKLFLEMAEDSPWIIQDYRRWNLTKNEWNALRKRGIRPALFHGVKDGSARRLARADLVKKPLAVAPAVGVQEVYRL